MILRSLGIKQSLILTFALLFAGVLFLSFWMNRSLDLVDEKQQKLYHKHVLAISKISQLKARLWEQDQQFEILFQSQGANRDQSNTAPKVDGRHQENLLVLQHLEWEEQDSGLLKQVMESFEEYHQLSSKCALMWRSGEKAPCQELYLRQAEPQLRHSLSLLGQMEQRIQSLASEEYQNSRNQLAQFQNVLWASVLAFGLYALLMCIVAIRQILGQIGKEPAEVLAYVKKVAAGDLSLAGSLNQVPKESLLAHFKSMVEGLHQTMARVKTVSEILASSAQEITSSSETLSVSASNMAAIVQETSASTEEMNSMISDSAKSSKLTESIASSASEKAKEGGESVVKTVEAMQIIAEKISIIDEIAYQTNLLALNAAIEAARAGEHGRGFAVVATEVRKLAERSQSAAQEIGDLAQRSVATAEHTGLVLNEILPAVQKTADLIQEMSMAAMHQSSSVSQINLSMMQISNNSIMNASTSEELSATAAELSHHAQSLNDMIRFFKMNMD